MKFTQIYNSNFNFPSLWKVCILLLLFWGASVKSFGQIYIGKDAIVSVHKETKIHISEDKTGKNPKAKVYVSENAQVVNFPQDSSIEIVYLKKEKQSPKIKKEVTPQNQSKIPSQPVLAKKETEPENRKAVLSFNSVPKTPSAFFLAGKSTKAALVQNTISGAKSFPLKKSYNPIIHSFLLNGNQKIKVSSNEFLLTQQTDLEGHITRPPPFQMA